MLRSALLIICVGATDASMRHRSGSECDDFAEGKHDEPQVFLGGLPKWDPIGNVSEAEFYDFWEAIENLAKRCVAPGYATEREMFVNPEDPDEFCAFNSEVEIFIEEQKENIFSNLEATAYWEILFFGHEENGEVLARSKFTYGDYPKSTFLHGTSMMSHDQMNKLLHDFHATARYIYEERDQNQQLEEVIETGRKMLEDDSPKRRSSRRASQNSTRRNSEIMDRKVLKGLKN
eukprot:gene439-891_t